MRFGITRRVCARNQRSSRRFLGILRAKRQTSPQVKIAKVRLLYGKDNTQTAWADSVQPLRQLTLAGNASIRPDL